MGNEQENKIATALRATGIKFEREFKAIPKRKFRFDFAVPEHKILIEFNGGIYTHGRHVRGISYAKDMEKYRLATLQGWRVLTYTTADTKKKNWEYEICEDVKDFIKRLRREFK